MNIKLVKLAYEYKDQLFEMLEEWKRDIEENHTNGSPWMIFRNDYHDFDYYLEHLEIKEATAMISLALEKCRELGIEKVLMCCDKHNIGSAKSIINNGGILENEIEEDGDIKQRYWIQL